MKVIDPAETKLLTSADECTVKSGGIDITGVRMFSKPDDFEKGDMMRSKEPINRQMNVRQWSSPSAPCSVG